MSDTTNSSSSPVRRIDGHFFEGLRAFGGRCAIMATVRDLERQQAKRRQNGFRRFSDGFRRFSSGHCARKSLQIQAFPGSTGSQPV